MPQGVVVFAHNACHLFSLLISPDFMALLFVMVYPLALDMVLPLQFHLELDAKEGVDSILNSGC